MNVNFQTLIHAALLFSAAVVISVCQHETPFQQVRTDMEAQPTASIQIPVTHELLTGEAAKGDWTTDAPGVRRKLTPADLPAPCATESLLNHPRQVAPPEGAMPQVPAGFRVEKFAAEMDHFSDCMLNNKTPRTPGAMGVADMRIITAIQAAMHNGKAARLKA